VSGAALDVQREDEEYVLALPPGTQATIRF